MTDGFHMAMLRLRRARRGRRGPGLADDQLRRARGRARAGGRHARAASPTTTCARSRARRCARRAKPSAGQGWPRSHLGTPDPTAAGADRARGLLGLRRGHRSTPGEEAACPGPSSSGCWGRPSSRRSKPPSVLPRESDVCDIRSPVGRDVIGERAFAGERPPAERPAADHRPAALPVPLARRPGLAARPDAERRTRWRQTGLTLPSAPSATRRCARRAARRC